MRDEIPRIPTGCFGLGTTFVCGVVVITPRIVVHIPVIAGRGSFYCRDAESASAGWQASVDVVW